MVLAGLLGHLVCLEIPSEVAPFLELLVPRESVVTQASTVPPVPQAWAVEELAPLDHLVFLEDLVRRVSPASLADLEALAVMEVPV